MALRSVAVICFTTVGLALIAKADDETFTQIGSFQCQYVPGNAPFAMVWKCPDVTFPKPFGASPNVIVSFSTFGWVNGGYALADIKPSEITPLGFQPALVEQNLLLPTAIPKVNGPPPTLTISWTAVGPLLLTGSARPKYLVLTVIYAPPGTNGGHSTSSVSYQAGSSTGTTTSASQSFKAANSLSFEASGGILGTGGSGGVSFEYSRSTTDSQSLDIKKSTTATITQAGPAQDGINHDEDEIWLLLNPTVNLALSSSSAAWLLANTQSPVQYVHCGWLNGHQTMPPGVATALQSAGITAQDYPDILVRDPFSGGSSPLDPQRFVSLSTTFPYEPPYAPSDPVPTTTFNVSDSSAATVGTTVADTYKVGLSMSASGGFLDFAKATLKDTSTWEWTNKTSQSSSTGTSQSATVTVGGPAYGYSGPTVMQVYLDSMYHTFAFVIVPAETLETAVKGTLTTSAGSPLPKTEVTLVENGKTHRTFTNGKGEFTFFGSITGPATVRAAGTTQTVRQAREVKNIILRRP